MSIGKAKMARTRIFSSLVFFGLFHVATGGVCIAESPRPVVRPNLIFIYTDDQRFDALGANGNAEIRTPHLDQLCERGLRFINSHVVMSLCSPSRAAVLTGRYGSANGVTGLDQPLRQGERTFAQELKQAGYQTAFVGKWHLKTRVPDAGFDFRCYFTGNGAYHNRRVWDNGRFVSPTEHVDAFCVRRSIAFLKQAVKNGRPFVLFHATQLPHMNHQLAWPSQEDVRQSYDDDKMPLPGTWEGDLSGKPEYLADVRNRTQALKYGYDKPEAIRRHAGDYYSVVTELDAMLGQLLESVESMGLWNNTYVIFMSDNGWLLGEHRFTSKVLPYDSSTRVPLVVAGPNVRIGVEDRIALNIDIAPTLLELAGVAVPKRVQGRSLVPLLSAPSLDAPKAKWRDVFVYECIGGYGGTRPTLGAVSTRWKLIHTWNAKVDVVSKEPVFVELYDLQSDPDEKTNVRDEPHAAAVRRGLAREIRKHIENRIVPAQRVSLEPVVAGANRRQFSGIYPHLASFNSQGECGTGAVAAWSDRLWWVTYSPHMPNGSDDKLYVANKQLDLFTWSGSVGGTPANRMIHRESQQLLIGPYLIDKTGKIRVIPQSVMRGRLTGNARHLVDPINKVYYATMEEGFYEVDVMTLAVTELFPDANNIKDGGGELLPGYHGKGLYSGQGVLVYANNGEKGQLAMTRPDIASGALAEWSGQGDWRVVLRNQFTEVSGPGGIFGNERAATDPIWTIGWDHRSLILMVRDNGKWCRFRLPKASHSYDGAHGWNTEWPRIREIGEQDLLMTMHGTFWRFPRSFRVGQASGIAPRSTYLKVIGDFCRWHDRIVLGCDDTAQKEFLNTRRAKGKIGGPAQSQSNLWFIEPDRLDQLGPTHGRGAVWFDDSVTASEPSDAFLFGGFAARSVHLVHQAEQPVTFRFEVDRQGDDTWAPLEEVSVPANGYAWHRFPTDQTGEWIRVSTDIDCQATVWFEMRNPQRRTAFKNQKIDDRFVGLGFARGEEKRGGLVRAGNEDTGLKILATRIENGVSKPLGYYELKPDLSLARVESRQQAEAMVKEVAIPTGILKVVGRSILYVDDNDRRFRLPIGNSVYLDRPKLLDLQRTSREAATERDLFQCAGTFFELPARNAGGFAKIRPISTHSLFVQDYCSWRGLLVLSGVTADGGEANSHIVRSSDGECAVWLGAVDDLWDLGKPVGRGGPWTAAPVKANEPSDPYLLAGYDRKRATLSHTADEPVQFKLEVDISGTSCWCVFQSLDVPAGQETEFEFPAGFEAYWIRLVTDQDCTATAEFLYE